MENRKYLMVAFVAVAILAGALYVISKAVEGMQSELYLWGVAIAAAVAFLSSLKNVSELVKQHWPQSDGTVSNNESVVEDDPPLDASPIIGRPTFVNKNEADSPYYSCFISFSEEDEAFALKLREDLQVAGVKCWFAPEDLKIGEKKRIALGAAVLAHRKLLLILSKHSTDSEWVGEEVEMAIDKEEDSGELVLFPIRLDDSVFSVKIGWAAYVKRRYMGDFGNWKEADCYQRSFKKVLRDLTVEPGEEDG